MSASPLVVVTGSAGRIGRAAVRGLKANGCTVRGYDLAPTPGADESMVGDIADAPNIRRAMEGATALVHLAAVPDDDDFLTKLLPSNIIGVYHVMEAAREAGVQRIILGSSGQVVWWQRFTGPLPVGADVAPSPRGWYAATKVFLEAAGRSFAELHGQSVITVRLGWCPRSREHADELARTAWGPDVYLSPADASRFFACAVAAPTDIRYAVVYAMSRPLRRIMHDMAPARDLLGYEPCDTWPEGIESLDET
jgi:nucleoside-diphosphate-sugar epimerase